MWVLVSRDVERGTVFFDASLILPEPAKLAILRVVLEFGRLNAMTKCPFCSSDVAENECPSCGSLEGVDLDEFAPKDAADVNSRYPDADPCD